MLFRDWMAQKGYTIEQTANALKVSRTTLCRVLTGQRPSLLLAYKIILFTKNEITIKDLLWQETQASDSVQISPELQEVFDIENGIQPAIAPKTHSKARGDQNTTEVDKSSSSIRNAAAEARNKLHSVSRSK